MRDKFLFYNLADLLPSSASQSAPDPGHVNGCTQFLGFDGNAAQSFAHRIVTNWSNSSTGSNVMLPDKIGDPDVWSYFDKLHLTQSERLAFLSAMPGSIMLLRFEPAS